MRTGGSFALALPLPLSRPIPLAHGGALLARAGSKPGLGQGECCLCLGQRLGSACGAGLGILLLLSGGLGRSLGELFLRLLERLLG